MNSGDPDQTPHYVASGLGLHCLHWPHKKDASLIWVKPGLYAYTKKHKGFMSWPIKEFVTVSTLTFHS